MIASFLALFVHYFFQSDSIVTAVIVINVMFIAGAVLCERTNIKGADEFFGTWLALFLAPKIAWVYATAFFLFNFFIVYQPKRVRNLSKKIPGGLAPMLEAAVAGFLSFCIVQILLIPLLP